MPLQIGKALVFQPGRHRIVVLLLMKLLTHFTILSWIFFSFKLCSSHAGITLLKASVMSSVSSMATPSLFYHVPCIIWTRTSREVSIVLSGWASMYWAGRRLYSSDKIEICCPITLSRTFPIVCYGVQWIVRLWGLSSLICLTSLRKWCCSDIMRWSGRKNWYKLGRKAEDKKQGDF